MIESLLLEIEQLFIQGYWFIPFLIFLSGIVTSIGPCNLSMTPVLLAYINSSSTNEKGGRKGFVLSLAFTLGSALTFVILGIIIALFGGLFGTTQTVFSYIAATVCLLMGLILLNLLHIQLPSLADVGQKIGIKPPTNPKKYRSRRGAFTLGMILGITGSQCGAPILLVILTYVLLNGQMMYGAVLLFLYGLGRGVPLMIIGTITGATVALPKIAAFSEKIEKFAGVFLIGLSLYLFWSA
ncbi:cytochrome c biogenesis protein CcdA [Bacillaceae bacterium IKA-2]|nr:cytochrome c biogenesis protein CcdA [Bacillaceae bacterium IKA-2]